MDNNLKPDDRKLFLLDAMALIYRAFYAVNKNPRINSKGLNTSAIIGFANTLYDVLKNERPTHIAVAFDTQAPTLRHDEYTQYKANREEMPEDLATSIPYIKKLIRAFNIPVLLAEGYEADDVIGTLARKAEEQGFTTYMMTSDKDFGQLVTEKTLIYKPAKMGEKAQILGVKEVCEKFSIERPGQLIDILGLWGDASDNIPGIPGFGEVTAKKLIAEFGSIENLIENSEKISNQRWKEKVQQYSEIALQSKSLATIITDVPVEFDESKLHLGEPDENALKELFEELEFRNFAKRVFTDLLLQKQPEEKKSATQQTDLFSSMEEDFSVAGNKENINTTAHNYYLCNSVEKRKELLNQLEKSPFFCFDTETTGIDTSSAELVGISFSIRPHEAWYIPLPDNYAEAHSVIQEFAPLFTNVNKLKIGQNIKFDIGMLRWYDIAVSGPLFDTMLAHYLLQPDMRHNLNILAESYLNYSPVPIEALIGKKGKNQLSMKTVDLETLKEYACEDADITLQLKEVFDPMLKEAASDKLFENIEAPLITILAAMESEGVKINTEVLIEYSRQLFVEISELEKEIFQHAGTHFNISSPKQLGEVLFDKMHIVEKPKKTQTKQYSTAEDVLVKLENKHPIIRNILDYRSLTKLKSTYVDVLPGMINPRTGRLHTTYNQAVASTGRLSSNNPNLQNIPIRTDRGREIRRAFVPRNEEYILLCADYSQIELRIIASLSGEANMINDFREGLDVHTATASRVYGVPLADVTRDMRRNAKTVNFGIIYGISAFGLSERLSIPRKEAMDIIDQYFIKYPAIKKYMNNTIESARKNGYVETIMGRKRYVRDITSGNAIVRGFAERNAINAPIQGSAADMIKIAMINIHSVMNERNLLSKMILQVHDELVFDVHLNELDDLQSLVREKMEGAIQLDVPLVADLNHGLNWLEAH